jgi:hypothetical protein
MPSIEYKQKQSSRALYSPEKKQKTEKKNITARDVKAIYMKQHELNGASETFATSRSYERAPNSLESQIWKWHRHSKNANRNAEQKCKKDMK